MKSVTTSGLICVKDKLNIEYSVCKIDYIINEDDTYKFVFTPYYDVIDLLESDIFQGIPGLNLDLRKEEYIRENMRPVFISERVPSEKREGYRDFLKKVGMDYMDPVEYLIRTDYKYSGDNFYVIRYKEREKVVLDNIPSEYDSIELIENIINNISHGKEVYLDNGKNINDKNIFETLLFIYSKIVRKQKPKEPEEPITIYDLIY